MSEEAGTRVTTTRIEAFSDGVFAIAITLLILEIKVPEAHDGHLWSQLGHLWPSYAAYATSFLTIGVIWINHHALFAAAAEADRGLMFRNLGLLGVVSFLPFPTALLAQFVRDGGADAHLAAAVYGVAMAVLGTTFALMWRHLQRHPELLRGGSAARVELSLRRSVMGPGAYLAGALVGLVAPFVALVVYACCALFFALSRTSNTTTEG